MLKKVITHALSITSILVSTSVSASAWNFVVSVGDDTTLYFFDADTVQKKGNVSTLWVKSVELDSPDKHGAWATALRWRIDCSARTIQTLAWSDYDNEGNFLKSNNQPASPRPATPDTVGESILEIACEPNFPRDMSGEKYFKIVSNDVFQARDDYVRLRAQNDTAPK